jgi:hypothetical protein
MMIYWYNFLCLLKPLINICCLIHITRILQGKYDYPHFIDMQTKIQRDEMVPNVAGKWQN